MPVAPADTCPEGPTTAIADPDPVAPVAPEIPVAPVDPEGETPGKREAEYPDIFM